MMCKTYKKDIRTRFWVKICEEANGGCSIYVADCLMKWIEDRYPNLLEHSKAGWELTARGKNVLHFSSSESAVIDWVSLDRELDFAGNHCFWPKVPDQECGGGSLDLCVVGDYHANPECPEQLTDLGMAFTLGKYGDKLQRDVHVQTLASHVKKMVSLLPLQNSISVVASIPTKQDEVDCFSHAIARSVAELIERPIFKSRLTVAKPAVKNLELKDKIRVWNELLSGDGSVLHDELLQEAIVILVDDLYQSGVTMCSFARYLKRIGAKHVYGLACVKSLRDDANVRG